MKKSIAAILVFNLTFFILAQTQNSQASAQTARAVAAEASKKDSVEQSVNYLKKTIPALTVPCEQRSSCAFLAGILEQTGNYQEAITYYAKAAAIAAKDADGMPKKSSEQLVIDAVRCALSAGDWSTALNYLNSAVRNSTDPQITGYVKLYEQWGALCKAEKIEDTEEAVAMLKTYSSLDSMKSVCPQILLTLWHVTGEASWSDALKKDFPKTPECAVVKGEINILPAPYWYFVPRSSTASPEVEKAPAVEEKITENASKAQTEEAKVQPEESEKIVRQQLGLFRDKANADGLIQKLKEKGFTAKITDEVRPSGTKYYLVVVDENKDGTMGSQLRNAGFECYPVFE